MRLSASRIRSINRAIARVQSSAWSAPDRNRRPLANPTLADSVNAAEFVKVVVVPRTATL
jgi:hypothetical protein